MLFHLFAFPFSFLASHFGVNNRDGVSLIRNVATICNFIRWICKLPLSIQCSVLKSKLQLISCRQTFLFREAFLKSIINVPTLLYYVYMHKLPVMLILGLCFQFIGIWAKKIWDGSKMWEDFSPQSHTLHLCLLLNIQMRTFLFSLSHFPLIYLSVNVEHQWKHILSLKLLVKKSLWSFMLCGVLILIGNSKNLFGCPLNRLFKTLPLNFLHVCKLTG
jgi:hypothetical protein